MRLSYEEVDRLSDILALQLAKLGVGRGDVVSFQLPNWWEFSVLHLACLKLGAVSNPLMIIFRERELRFMLRLAETKVFVVPAAFRGFDYAGMAVKWRSSTYPSGWSSLTSCHARRAEKSKNSSCAKPLKPSRRNWPDVQT